MKVAEIAAVTFYGICGGLAIYWAIKVHDLPPRLPCQVSEISPDFSTAQREQCRVMRSHKL